MFTSNINPFSLKGEGGENTCKLSHSGVNNSSISFIKFEIPVIFGKVQMEVPILYPWLIGEKENLREEKFKEKERKMKDFFHWKFLCVLEITQLNIIIP